MINDNDIRLCYFQVRNIGQENRTGYICMAIMRPPKSEGIRTYQCAFAFCSPREEFSKRIARTMAIGRLKKTINKGEAISFDSDAKRLSDVFVCGLMETVRTSAKTPSWLIKESEHPNIAFGLNQNSKPFGGLSISEPS